MIYKSSNSTLNYTLDYADWLQINDVVVSHTVTASSNDISIQQTSNDDSSVSIVIDDGINGITYKLTVAIVTQDGLELHRLLYVRVQGQAT